MKTDCRKEALEKIRRDFTSYHATAKKGSRYPLYLRQMVREAARKGIQKERLVEASEYLDTRFQDGCLDAQEEKASRKVSPSFRLLTDLLQIPRSSPRPVCLLTLQA
jgi:hypothetical protein